MKKNPGRKERRWLKFASRRYAGRKRARFHDNYYHQKAMKGEANG